MSAAKQTVEAALNPHALLRIGVVSQLTGWSEPSIYRKVREKKFPAPVKDGARCTRWPAGVVTAWLQERAGAPT